MPSSMVGLRGSKALPKTKLAPKRGHGHCLMVCWQSDPLQLSESQQNHYIWEVCSASMRCTENCKTCNWHWSTERAKFFTTKPDCTLHNQSSKSWKNELLYFVSSAIFTWPLAQWLPLVQVSPQLFEGKMGPQPAGGRECFPRAPQVLKHIFLCYRNKHISHWKIVDCNCSYFDS